MTLLFRARRMQAQTETEAKTEEAVRDRASAVVDPLAIPEGVVCDGKVSVHKSAAKKGPPFSHQWQLLTIGMRHRACACWPKILSVYRVRTETVWCLDR